MAKVDGARIGDIEIARAVIAHEAERCFVGKEGKASVQPRRLVSCTGGTFYGRPGEAWPVNGEEEPLIPWLQVACTEMKGLGGAFYQKKCVCFYIHADFDDFEATSAVDESDFVVRTYGLSEKLVPLKRPRDLKGHPFRPVAWEEALDYPSISKYRGLFEEGVYKALCEEKKSPLENRGGIKIGGWPTPVQRRQRYPGSCDLQIDMTENFMYGDSGVGYLRRRGEAWHVIFESC
jgi:uncharacterized protein YwqG